MTWRETAAYRCMFGSIISIDLYKQEPIFILPKAQGERYADRRRQGIGACHALGAQFREGREGSERGDADAALRHGCRRPLGCIDQQGTCAALVLAGRGRSPVGRKVSTQG